VKTLIMLMLFL